jgi:hypothetical protein
MDNTQILTAFNTHFIEFIDDIQRVFPNNLDIATAKNGLIQLRKANPRLLILSYKEYMVMPYRAEIQEGDLSFFINNDYRKDLNKLGVKSPNNILERIDCLRAPIKEMDENSQQNVIKYLQNLQKLSDLYMI